MSNAYYARQPTRQPTYESPLHDPPYNARGAPFPPSSSSTNMLATPHDDGVDYHLYHSPAAPHTLQPYNDVMRSSFSNENLMRDPHLASQYKDPYAAEDDATFRGADYTLAKDESGRLGYGRGHRIEATDGLLPDVAPDLERLNPEQREIMKQFPPDLDDQGGGKSGLQAAKDLLKDWKSWFKLRYLHWWIMLVVVIAIVALTTIYHRQIVDWLTPISKKVTTVAWGWIIPVAILFIISFPPLFGHEIVLILVGLVYGIWIGFGIASLGTLLGEIGNFYAFKHCLRSTAASYERKNIHYACMAEMVRDGGFWVMFLARLSAIPGHFTTAVFATVGMNIFIFTFAAVLALPKQLLIVYLGVAIKNSGNGTEDTKSKIIKYMVLVISFIITVWTAYWLYQKMEKVRPGVSARLRQKRYELLLQARTLGTEGFRGGREEHVYPPRGYGGGGGGGGVDASLGYRQQQQQQPEEGDLSTDTYVQGDAGRQLLSSQQQQQQQYAPEPSPARPMQQYPPPSAPPASGRQPTTQPMQFHRPIRQNSSPTSPFHDPAEAATDGFPPAARNEAQRWSPVEAPPPDYTSYTSHTSQPQQQQQQQQHPRSLLPQSQQPPQQQPWEQQSRVDPTVQRYHLSD